MPRFDSRLLNIVKVCVSCSLIAAAVRAAALDPQKAISQYIQTVWTTDSGLPQTSIYSIAQTADGYLWLGTELGLARFDGMRFTVYNQRNTEALPANYIACLLGARDGSLWIGTDSGLVHLKDGAWTTYTTREGLSSNDIHALHESSDGSLWVGTGQGLDRLQSGRFKVYGSRDGLPGTSVTSLLSDRSGTLWIATDAGLARFDGQHFTSYSALSGLTNNNLSALAVAPDGSIWIAAAHGQLARLAGGHVENESKSLIDDDIDALLFDHDGNLWIGFESHGLARLHGGVLSLYGMANGLPGQTVERFFEDSEHNLWVGLFDGGLVQLRDGKFKTYGKPEGLSSNVGWAGLQAHGGSIWMGTSSGGLDRLMPDGKVGSYSKQERQSEETIHSMLEARDGAMWFGLRHGALTRFQNGKFTTFTYDRSTRYAINSLLEERDGSLIVGTYGAGVARFKGDQFQVIVPAGEIPALAEAPDGTLWIGTDGGGLIQLKDGVATTFTTANGLLNDHIVALYLDREGTLWIGTMSGGLNRLKNGPKNETIASITTDQGLFDSTVGNILEDRFGNLWMGSDNGIFRAAKRELNDLADGKISSIHCVVYGTPDGLRSHETMEGGTGSAAKGPDGRLWFSTMRGLSVVDPGNTLDGEVPLEVRIESVIVNGKSFDAAQTLRIGPRASRLEIHFTAPGFAAPSQIQFRYRLDGFDSEWSAALKRRRVEYTNLPPGDYRFEVEASRNGVAWTGPAESPNLTVIPPWYRTLFAYVLYALVAFILGWFAIEARTRSLKRRSDELEQLIAERTSQLEVEKKGLIEAREELQFQASHDSLTGLWTHGAIFEQLNREMERASREHSALTVILGDLDHFKAVNDSHGHLCGDYVLCEAAHRLAKLMRGYDTVGRSGGEEFLILLPGYDAAENPQRAQQLVDAIGANPIDASGTLVEVTCSYGVAVFRPWLDPVKVDDLIRRADKALYRAKDGGRNRIEFDSTAAPAKIQI